MGTSGIRAMVIDQQQQVLASNTKAMPSPKQPQPNYFEQRPQIWLQTLQDVLTELAAQFDFKRIVSVSLDATSGTVLLTDKQNNPLTTGLMYNDQRAAEFVEQIKQHAPADSPTCAASSGLAKALWLIQHTTDSKNAFISHQADWLAAYLTHLPQRSDSNNALKTGYDPLQNKWPEWLNKLGIQAAQLPQVSKPGTVISPLDSKIIKQYHFNPEVKFVSGTTDSTAALMATGANQPGDAVTSLGSTLVLKIISETPIFSSAEGIYSQPFGNDWLVGGASNSGGAVLRHYFTDQQMAELQPQLNPAQSSGLDYYPLLQTGERFPFNNPQQAPRLTPRPQDDALFFQGMLEGITAIEQQGYKKLQQLGAPTAKRLFTVGGGTVNKAWTTIRQQILKIPMHKVLNNEAAFGAALLAKQGYDTEIARN